MTDLLLRCYEQAASGEEFEPALDQVRGRFQEITEDDVLAYLTQGKIGGDQCHYIKSVLQDCRPVLAGSELERIIRILPMIPRCQKVCDFLTDSEVKALRDVIMSEDKLSLRNRSSRVTP